MTAPVSVRGMWARLLGAPARWLMGEGYLSPQDKLDKPFHLLLRAFRNLMANPTRTVGIDPHDIRVQIFESAYRTLEVRFQPVQRFTVGHQG